MKGMMLTLMIFHFDDIPRFGSGQMKLEYFVKICILVSNSILVEMRTMGRDFS